MKDALGHGSDPHGLGNGPDPRGLRSHVQIVGKSNFSGKVLGGYSPSSAGQSLVNAVRGGSNVETHPSMVNSSGHAWGSPAALADFKREFGGPRNHAAEDFAFRSGQREIARLRRQGK